MRRNILTALHLYILTCHDQVRGALLCAQRLPSLFLPTLSGLSASAETEMGAITSNTARSHNPSCHNSDDANQRCASISDHMPGKSGIVLRVVAMLRISMPVTASPIMAAKVAIRWSA